MRASLDSSHDGVTRGRRVAWRGRVLFAVLLAVAAGVGCSARKLAYQMMPMLVMSSVDQAIGLTPAQKDVLRPEIRRILDWHRRQELPLYAARLDDLRARLRAGLTPADVKWTRETVNELWDRASQEVAPVASTLLATLQPAQIDRLEKMRATRRRDDARATRTADAFVARWAPQQAKSLETWMGPLQPSQKQLITNHLRRIYPDTVTSQRYLDRHLTDFLSLLRQRPSTESVEQEILELAKGRRAQRPSEMEVYQRLQAATDQLALDLFRAATPAQKAHLDAELSSLQKDMLELHRDAN